MTKHVRMWCALVLMYVLMAYGGLCAIQGELLPDNLPFLLPRDYGVVILALSIAMAGAELLIEPIKGLIRLRIKRKLAWEIARRNRELYWSTPDYRSLKK